MTGKKEENQDYNRQTVTFPQRLKSKGDFIRLDKQRALWFDREGSLFPKERITGKSPGTKGYKPPDTNDTSHNDNIYIKIKEEEKFRQKTNKSLQKQTARKKRESL